jgi:hypothetical protein
MNGITWSRFDIGKDSLYYALVNTTPQDLYGQLDGIVQIPEFCIKDAHKYYFGYNIFEKEFENLLSLISGDEFPAVTDNKIAKEEYNRMRFNKFKETNPRLRKILRLQRDLADKHNKNILIQETSNLLESLNPNISFNDKLNSQLQDIQDLIREQLYYVEHEAPCQKIFIMVFWRDMPIGGVVVFYNSDHPHYIYIQGITKYPIIYLIDTFYPQYTSHLPKLNTILDPIIQQIARELGVSYIYVNPVGRQGEFLEKYYGYQLNQGPIPPKPCPDILDTAGEITSYFKAL